MNGAIYYAGFVAIRLSQATRSTYFANTVKTHPFCTDASKQSFFFFFAIQCEDMEKSRSASRRIGGGNGAITDPPRPLLSLFSWQSTLRPDTDKEFDHFHEFSRNVSILGQVFPAMGIKGGEFMTAYSMHLPGRKIHVCSTFSGNSR